jgi:hypothetical protein
VLPRIGAARSTNRGRTWEDLGIILEAPAGTSVCDTQNRYFVGGVGDLSVLLDPDDQDLYLFFSQYGRGPAAQGVAFARMAWADRDSPVGRVAVWQQGAWVPPTAIEVDTAEGLEIVGFRYPAGTSLWATSEPWHDARPANNAFWGPSVHWNTFLGAYVMLLNRAKDEAFAQEGIYVSYSATLDTPTAWSAPQRLLTGGAWYPQVLGLEARTGTDKVAGELARFWMAGFSDSIIHFSRK